MSADQETAKTAYTGKTAYITQSTDSVIQLVPTLPTSFTKELYELLFRNKKVESTIYVISLLITLVYAVISHFILGKPQRTVLYEGSVLAVSVLVALIFGYTYQQTLKKALSSTLVIEVKELRSKTISRHELIINSLLRQRAFNAVL